ncbi:flavoprotein [Streptacidiphilus rugosus]|uniref:flavoprotein n=1 Tax=Streptacidiphilus rugosus TaxID=405783 RepID=UPI000559E408|nr:flavoprotein [Streptacidiphilus rugosus]
MTGDPVLYLLGTGAQPVLNIAVAVERAQVDGWQVCLGLTPTAARWLHPYLPGLEALTGSPVRSHYKLPGQDDVWPTADVVLLAPATFNTVNRLALGLTDSFVVGYAAEALGGGIPTVVVPCVNAALAAHPQFARSVETLQAAGGRLLLPETATAPGQDETPGFDWALGLAEARAAHNATSRPV